MIINKILTTRSMNKNFRKIPNVTITKSGQKHTIYKMCDEQEEFEVHRKQALQHLGAMCNLNNENSSFELLEVTANGDEFIHFEI